MTRWRYIAQRALTGEFLHWDLPLEVDSVTWELSGPGALTGTVSPDTGHLRGEDGDLVLQEWGTLIYAEADGIIRWGGILISSSFTGEAWSIEAAGFTTYPHGLPYLGDVWTRTSMDPADAVREIWRHIQSRPEGDLKVSVTGSTPVRLGDPGVPSYVEYLVDFDRGLWVKESEVHPSQILKKTTTELAASMTASQTTLQLLHLVRFDEMDHLLPYNITVGPEKIRVTGRNGHTLTGLLRAQEGTTAQAHPKGTGVHFPGTITRTVEAVEAEPYVLAWYEAPDCGSEIDELAQSAPFDYTEVHAWTDETKSAIRHEVQIHHPRIGRKRTDLSFVQGVNVTSVAAFSAGGDEYASEVMGLGAGEGRDTLRRATAIREGRLRRVAVYTDKAVTSTRRLDALIARELHRRRGLLDLRQVDVVNHPDAPLGSWSVGDDIYVRADVPWLGPVDLWVRITGWSLTGETTASLTVTRSDSFRYGG